MQSKGFLKAIYILIFSFMYCIMAFLLFQIGTDNLFYDSEKILDRLSNNYIEEQSLNFSDSYTLSAYLYRILTFSQDLNSTMLDKFRNGEFNIISLVFAFQFLAMLYMSIKLFSCAYRKNRTISYIAFFYMLFSALYLLIPSKDFFIFALSYLTMFVSYKLRFVIYIYSFFRPFLLVTFLIYAAITKLTFRKTLLLAAPILTLMYFIPMPPGLAKPSAFLTANTGIANLIPDSNMAVFFINGIINSIRVFFPIELFFLEFKHWLIALPKLALSVIFLYCLIKRRNNHNDRFFILIASFFYVQGLFEPDFGSALRHSFIILPLLIQLIPGRIK